MAESTAFVRSALIASTLLTLGGSLTLACSSEPPGGSNPSTRVTTGTATLPLVTAANGNVYRLANASVIICGASCTFLSSTDAPDESKLSTVLATGSYQASLQYWNLQKRDSAGIFQPVQATLVSSSTSFFQVFDGTTTTISYQFETDGVIVTVGQGSVNVDVNVTETSPACSPLGSDCGEGSWCPPSELTGTRLGCIGAGDVAIGQPCGAATSCVANASCFDSATGPVCVELCSDAQFGQACASGGTCEAVGTTYGLCR